MNGIVFKTGLFDSRSHQSQRERADPTFPEALAQLSGER